MDYLINGTDYDYDSIVNQRIKGRWVERNVVCCVTSMVEYILRKNYGDEDRDAPFSIDDIENFSVKICPQCNSDCGFSEADVFYRCEGCEVLYETEDEATCCGNCVETGEYSEDYESVTAYKCDSCGHIVADEFSLDVEDREVFEWWVVSNWALEKLRLRDEVVIPHMNIWGRTCTGQAIKLDGVIGRICKEMGMLEGQEYEWKAA